MSSLSAFYSIKESFYFEKDNEKIFNQVIFTDINSNIDDFIENSIAIISIQQKELSRFEDSLIWQSRQKLYNLYLPVFTKTKIYDLGIFFNESLNYEILINTLNQLITKNIRIIILSPFTSVYTLLYKGLEKSKKSITISEVNNILPNQNEHDYLPEILSYPDCKIFNYTNLGQQSFLNSISNQDLFKKLLFDTYRMGQLQQDIMLAEPCIRDSDLLSLNLNAVSSAYASAIQNPSPTGFTGFEICRFSRFAGLSERNSIIAFSGYNMLDDPQGNTSSLIAQALWFYFEAFFSKKSEKPTLNDKNFQVYYVDLDKKGNYIFMKSHFSDRWWVQIENNFGKKMMISCNNSDYLLALNGDIPERLWKIYQKIL